MPNMTNFFKQFYLLQWKNIKLKQRQWAKTSIELVMPLVFFMILVAVRQSQNFIRSSPECDYRPTPLASDGLLAALRSACHLGVCQSSESVSRDETADGEWYGNASTALAAVNKLMAHRTTRLVASAALKALPTNWTDPDQVKQVPLKRLFTRPKDLFNGVNATDDEIRQLMSATVPLPKKLNLRLDFLLRSALLAQSMPSDVEAPQTVCILVASQSLCSQARFRSNLAQMFSPVQLVDQLASSDRDSIPLPIRFSDAVSLKPVISKLVSLKDAGVLNFLDDFWSRIAALEPATTASEATASPPTALAMLDRLERLSDVACGHGASTLRQITGRLRARLAGRARKPDTKHAGPEARPTLPPVGEADESGNSSAARRLVDLDAVELAQPEQFCFNASYQFALLGSVGSLLSSLGFDSLSVLAFGEIAYSPDTESVRRHLRRINETLTGIADVSRVAELWLTNETERAAQFLANGPLLPALQIFLSACPSPACQAAVAALSAESGSTAADGSFNDTEAAAAASNFSTAPWRRGLSWADWAARRLYYATACFRLSKLHGFANESALNARVEQLLRNYDAPPPSSDESPAASGPGPQRGPLPRAALLPKAGGGGGSGGSGSSGNGNETEGKDGELSEQMPHLLAALVFDSDSDTFVRYRLRMPEYAVDSTRHYKVLDRVWTPGPRAEFPQDFKYFTSFFIHLQ
uniref:ABC transporter domain-containing protein n=2 Tax=Macrostomum lignano TaxID=282301 RepID=A0A1I8H155_9PLAT